MATVNVGGRPKNTWTSSRLRKLIRLHQLSNTKVELIPEILMRAEGFKTCLRDVHTQLSIIGSKNTGSSRRRRRKTMARSQLNTICMELKPSNPHLDLDKERKTAIASQASETLLESMVVDDRLYNPLLGFR